MFRVLLANDPLSYREALAGALRTLRPLAEVRIAGPGAIDREVLVFRPHVVFCDVATPMVKTTALAWVELYPGGHSLVRIGAGEEHRTLDGIVLTDLLALMDCVEQSTERSMERPTAAGARPCHEPELR